MARSSFFRTNTGMQFTIAIVSALLFVPFLGQVHLFDWDEINFAESAREMIVSGNYLDVQVNFKAFWEKPPLFIWMQVLSMKLFGINEFAARFPNAICGIVSLLVLFNVGKQVYGKKFGLIWVLVYAGSFLPFFYFKSGIIDPWFNLFIFLGVYFIVRYFNQPKHKHAVLSAFFIGLSVLTKGPVGFLIFVITLLVFIVLKRFRVQIKWIDVVIYAFVTAFVGGFWFLLQIVNGNYDIIVDFIEYQVYLFSKEGAGHGGFFFYHFVILLFGVFPASIFALWSFRQSKKEGYRSTMHLFMLVLFWTVLILFTIVNTKIVHYSSMCYFPMTYLGTLTIYKSIKTKRRFKPLTLGLLWFIGFVFCTAMAAIPIIGLNAGRIVDSGVINDPFTSGNLQANVVWFGYEAGIGLIIITGLTLFTLYNRARNIQKAVIVLFIANILFSFTAMAIITPKIEGYSQRAVIDFYQSKAQEDCYLEPLGFKSYAHYFYGKVKDHGILHDVNEGWLLEGEIDKDVYFVMKAHKAGKYLKEYPELDHLFSKNGFVFAVRKAQ